MIRKRVVGAVVLGGLSRNADAVRNQRGEQASSTAAIDENRRMHYRLVQLSF